MRSDFCKMSFFEPCLLASGTPSKLLCLGSFFASADSIRVPQNSVIEEHLYQLDQTSGWWMSSAYLSPQTEPLEEN